MLENIQNELVVLLQPIKEMTMTTYESDPLFAVNTLWKFYKLYSEANLYAQADQIASLLSLVGQKCDSSLCVDDDEPEDTSEEFTEYVPESFGIDNRTCRPFTEDEKDQVQYLTNE